MKSTFYTIILVSLLFLFFQCKSKYGIERDILPEETITASIIAENCATIIENNFEISIEEIKENHWDQILKNRKFISKNKDIKNISVPKFNYFRIIFINTGEFPQEIGDIKLEYNAYSETKLSDSNNKYLYNSGLDFHQLFDLYKIDIDDICLDEIDYTRDLTKYEGEKINPGDKILKIIAFKWIPVEIRKFDIYIEIKSDIIQKTVDFKLRRFEYRQSGSHFNKLIENEFE